MTLTGSLPVVSAQALSKVYVTPQSTVQAVDKVSIELSSGEATAIVGPSGSGKSTLLSLLGLLASPSACERFRILSNDCVIPGRRGEQVRDDLRARSVGFVFQKHHLLLSRTVVENVSLGTTHAGWPNREAGEAAEEILHKVGLGHRIHALASTLSGGEAQRAAVARAIVKQPAIILCDEPTGSLDDQTATRIEDLIFGETDRGAAVLVVTHSEQLSLRCDTRYVMNSGRIAPG